MISVPKNNLKISQMEKRCLPCRNLDGTGGKPGMKMRLDAMWIAQCA